jgi:hypothetical protein
MTFAAKGPPPWHGDDPLELSSLGAVDGSDLKPPRPNGQIKFQNPAETDFDTEIALALAASGWRVAAHLLIHAAKLIEAGDFQSAERNRRQAFRQFQEARRAAADDIVAEAFR